MEHKKTIVFLDVLYLFSSITLLIALLITLYYSIQYMTTTFPKTQELQPILFFTSLMITIITVHAQWIEGRMTAIVNTTHSLKRRYKTWQKKKHTQD